jgi:hypothetical protein
MADFNYYDDGSDYSSSSDGSSSGGSSNSDLIAALIGAGTSIGTTAILATQAPNSIAPNSYVPLAGNATPGIYAAQNQMYASQQSTKQLLIFGALAVAAILVFKNM